MANRLHVPFGYLFLSSPPKETIPLPDLRTIANRPLTDPSLELIEVTEDALRKQDWYREYRVAEGAERLSFVGRYSADSGADEVAEDMRKTLAINSSLREMAQSWERFLILLARNAEGAGVLVLRNGVVGNNTHRPLSVEEFRGFALSDPVAPIVFINAQDSKAAQIFTLVHELAHIWIGQSGVSNLDYKVRAGQQASPIDRFCDQVAAEVLVPLRDFIVAWSKQDDIDTNLWRLARRYRVSELVILRRALETDLIDEWEYREHFDSRAKRKGKGEGGDYHRNVLIRNSVTFTLSLLAAVIGGYVSYRDAATLLNVRMASVPSLYDGVAAIGVAGA
jgi:Zn-dependent peptidase ImmA (M78 family)